MMVTASYIFSFIFLLTLTLVPTNDYVLGNILGFIGIPTGYRSFVLMALAFPFLCIIVLNSVGKVWKPIWSVGIFWLPWIIYLGISGSFSVEGTWKNKMYLGKMVLPTMLIAIIAIANPKLFQKYFIRVLFLLNIIVMIALTLNLFGVRTFEKHFEGIERVIWLSRGIGICIVYMIITSEWRMRPMVLVMVSILLLQFGIMLYIGSRGPLLSVIVSMGIFFFIKYRKDITKTVLLGIVGVTIIVAFMNIKALSDYVHFFSTHRGTIKLSFFGQDRLVAYRPSLEIFADHPITGVGLGKWWSVYRPRMSPLSEIHDRSYLKKIRGEIDYDYPHNIFLEILSELGLVGMGLFVLLFIPFKRLFRLSNEYNLLCLLGFLYASSSSDISQNSAPMIFNILSILRAKNLLPASSD